MHTLYFKKFNVVFKYLWLILARFVPGVKYPHFQPFKVEQRVLCRTHIVTIHVCDLILGKHTLTDIR